MSDNPEVIRGDSDILLRALHAAEARVMELTQERDNLKELLGRTRPYVASIRDSVMGFEKNWARDSALVAEIDGVVPPPWKAKQEANK